MNKLNYNGVIDELIKGKWRNPLTNKKITIPIKKIEILPSIDGCEIDFIQNTHPNEKILLISDEFTREVLGKKIYYNLSKKFDISEYVWQNPVCSIKGVTHIQEISKDFPILIAVGSGTINDTVKYVTFLDKKNYSVFATSPMNAFTSPTASVSFNGFKKSIFTHSATGVYFDLSVLSKTPKKLIRAAFADVLCRTTSQVDWLLSNKLLNTLYDETPYILLNLYEKELIKNAKYLNNRNIESIALLTRVAAIMGLSTFFTRTTHYGSMAEHAISHFIDMFAKDLHPGTSHGEQVGIATLTISKIQNSILNYSEPPILYPTRIPEAEIKKYFGITTLNLVNQQMRKKILESKKTVQINNLFEKNWNKFVKPLKQVMLNFEILWNALGESGALRTIKEANIDHELYNKALRYSRFIRDRYSILDFADDSHQLEKYID